MHLNINNFYINVHGLQLVVNVGGQFAVDNDGVDFVPMSKNRNSLIHLLNIAGMGPIHAEEKFVAVEKLEVRFGKCAYGGQA